MRVTHVITRLIVGGAQENTVYSVLGLRRKPGLKVDLLSGLTHGPEGSIESEFASCPDALKIVPELVRPVRPWTDFKALRRLTAVFRSTRPDIVHTHSGKAGVVGRIAAARAGVRTIVHTIHGPSFGPFQGAFANGVFTAAERYAGRHTTHFVVVADAMTRQYLAAGIGQPGDYTKIYSGFNLDPFLAARNDGGLRARFGFQPEDIVIACIARLSALKGHDDLLAVASPLVKANSRIKFLLVGDGPLRPRIETAVRQEGLTGHFAFTGLVSPAAVPSLLGITDLLVHLSRREGLPRAVAQSCAAARPVVAYDCDGAGEVCQDGRTGFLVPAGDRTLLTRRVLELANDASLRREYGEAGRDFVRGRFSVEGMVDALHALYMRLAA